MAYNSEIDELWTGGEPLSSLAYSTPPTSPGSSYSANTQWSPLTPSKTIEQQLPSVQENTEANPSKSNLTNHEKLLAFANEYNVPCTPTASKLLSRIQSRFEAANVSDSDIQAARDLLLERRQSDPAYKPPSMLKRTFSKSKSDAPPVFDYKEVNRALDVAVPSEFCSLGLIKALMALGGDVNVSRRASQNWGKKLSKKDQDDQRSDLVRKAAAGRELEIVTFLAGMADEVSLVEGLAAALERRDLEIIKVLLEFNASVRGFGDFFLDEIGRKEEDLVELLVLAPVPPPQEDLNAALAISVGAQSQRVLSLLAFNNANADSDGAKALRMALEAENIAFVLTILLAKVSPSPFHLDLGIGETYRRWENSNFRGSMTDLIRITEVLLCAGAAGQEAASVLIKAVKRNESDLINTLIAYGISTDSEGGAALQHAVSNGQRDFIVKILSTGPNQESLSNGIRALVGVRSLLEAHDTATLIFQAGGRGEAVAEGVVAIVEGLQTLFTDKVQLSLAHNLLRLFLVQGNGDVNFRQGYAISLAAKNGDIATLDILLQQKPEVDSVTRALPLGIVFSNKEIALAVTARLLDAGASGTTVDKATITSISQGTSGIPLTTLLLKTANINYSSGKLLVTAIKNHNMEALELILAKNPTKSSLGSALQEAKLLKESERRTVIAAILAKGVSQKQLDTALINAVEEEKPDKKLIQMYLDAGSSPEFDDGASMIYTAKKFDVEILQILAANVLDVWVFSKAFHEAIQSTSQWFHSEKLPTLKFLLERGADGPSVVGCITWAASLFNLEVLQVFSEAVGVNEEFFTLAFGQATQAGTKWLSKDGLDVLLILLKHGATGELIDMALVQAVEAFCSGESYEGLLDVLLEYNASVNYKNGEVVQLAAEYGDVKTLQKLTSHGANENTINLALSIAIAAKHEEALLLQILDVLSNIPHTKLDVNFVYTDMDPPIFLCLQLYPRSVKICKRILELGVNLETQVTCNVYSDGHAEANGPLSTESIPVLFWALVQPEKAVGSKVLSFLISSGSDVHVSPKVSKTTSLILAAKYERSDILLILLKAKVKANLKDVYERSALFYASRNGDKKSVALLLKDRQKMVNDGSLHEAARECHADIIDLLVEAGHHPNFTSTKHEGRTALGELAMNCSCPSDVSRVEESMNALIAGKADPLKKSQGKTTIFLALDNVNPVPITSLLIERILWQDINHTSNIYKEGDYYYSPTMYISKGIMLSPHEHMSVLYRLLKFHEAEDHYYAGPVESGFAQPSDAVGLPEDIAEFERKRKVREQKDLDREKKRQELEEDHEDMQRRRAEEAHNKMLHQQAQHEQKMYQADEIAGQKIYHQQIQHDQSMQFSRENDALQKQIRATDAQQKERIQYRQHRQKVIEAQQTRELTLQFGRQSHQQKLVQEKQMGGLRAGIAQRKDAQAVQTQWQKNRLAWQKDSNHTRALGQQQFNGVRAASAKHRMNQQELITKQRTIVGKFQMDQMSRQQKMLTHR